MQPQPESGNAWTDQAVIYEVNIRQYTPEGTFNAFAKHLPRLKRLGVDVIWLMPVNPISELNRKGSLGSYYAVSNYKAVNPNFGTEADLHSLVGQAHQLGIKVVLDWVANHTGCDNVWTTEHPDWYVRNDQGGFSSPYDWTDTYELDYDNQQMRQGMIDAMKYWVSEFDVDGFRCDVAYEVPFDFWPQARMALDSIAASPLFMLAENEQPALQQTGAFDMCYNWPLKNLMFDIAHQRANAANLNALLVHQDSIFPQRNILMNHITNHDLNSWDGSEFVRFGDAVRAFAVLTYTLPGMPLVYTGQEVGMDKTLQFFEKDTVPSWTDNAWTSFYAQLSAIRHSNPALNSYTRWSEAQVSLSADSSLIAFERYNGGNRVLTVVNLSPEARSAGSLGIKNIDGYKDAFSNANASMPDDIEPWGYRILTK